MVASFDETNAAEGPDSDHEKIAKLEGQSDWSRSARQPAHGFVRGVRKLAGKQATMQCARPSSAR